MPESRWAPPARRDVRRQRRVDAVGAASCLPRTRASSYILLREDTPVGELEELLSEVLQLLLACALLKAITSARVCTGTPVRAPGRR